MLPLNRQCAAKEMKIVGIFGEESTLGGSAISMERCGQDAHSPLRPTFLRCLAP